MLGPALGAIAMPNMHVVVAEVGERGCRLLGELADPLDGVNFSGNLGENGRRVARSGADLEHSLAAAQPERLDHECDDVGLRDCLTLLDWQRSIFVGEFAKLLGQEGLARDAALASKTSSERTPRATMAFSTISFRS